MHGLTNRLVATEREGQVRHAPGDMRQRHGPADRSRRFDEVDAVIVVLFDTCGDREDVRIENDILRRQTRHFRQQLVGAGADFDLALIAIRLTRFIECHDDNGSAVHAHQPRLL